MNEPRTVWLILTWVHKQHDLRKQMKTEILHFENKPFTYIGEGWAQNKGQVK